MNSISKRTIFYSWQSDLMGATNRTLIEAALKIAVQNITIDQKIEVEPVIDRDVQGVPGSPDIAETIFQKINISDVIVSDISIIGRAGKKKRPTPNPNVLLELGYALGLKGQENIICVFNLATGKIPRDLPFDLQPRHAVTYTAREGDPERSSPRKELAGKLEDKLRTIFTRKPVIDTKSNVGYEISELIEQNNMVRLRQRAIGEFKKTSDELLSDRFSLNEEATDEAYLQRVVAIELNCLSVAEIIATGCFHNAETQLWIEAINQFASLYHERRYGSGSKWWFQLRRYPGIILFYSILPGSQLSLAEITIFLENFFEGR